MKRDDDDAFSNDNDNGTALVDEATTPHSLPQGEEQPPPGVRTMAILRWALVVGMALAAAASVLVGFGVSFDGTHAATGDVYYCPMHPQIQQDHPGQCPICSMNLVKKPPGAPATPAPVATMDPQPSAPAADAKAPAGAYTCPMHPEVVSDDPKARCPKCGMRLEPRKPSAAAANAVPGLAPVTLPEDRVQLIGVRTAKAERGLLTDKLRTVGAVEANERGLAQISTRFPGWIETLAAAETGTLVKRGQVLATIYSPVVLEAQEELLSALRWSGGDAGAAAPTLPGAHTAHGGGDGLVLDARHRLELLGIAPQEIETLVRTRRAQRAIGIRSPVDGHIITRRVTVGMAVQPGTPLYEIADLGTVWVVGDVYEADAARVRVGQVARFRSSSLPGETFTGKVSFIHPLLDTASRTMRVRLELKNQRGPGGLKLRPGMYGDVELDLPPSEALRIPAEAVVDTGELQYVFVAQGGGRFEPRRVKVGARIGDKVEVREGLHEGESVVTTANFLLDSESRLRAALQPGR